MAQFSDSNSDERWPEAAQLAAHCLPFRFPDGCATLNISNTLTALILGEGQFGPRHWQLSLPKRIYYNLKPHLPRPITRLLRQLYHQPSRNSFLLNWPIEDRYARFLWNVLKQLMMFSGYSETSFVHFWPDGHRYALVLTHDIEMADGQTFVRQVADLEESLGFRSSFNFVPERYSLDYVLMQELRQRGFEIGVHGLKHDGRLFNSYDEFMRRAERINHYLKEFGAVGFRAPLTHRQPEWMQALEIEYDLSFFDTDPFEPIPGGTMSIWPFQLGHFVELPYTLVQDYTLTAVLGETTPRLWLQKLEFLKKYFGMALLNTHPDYLREPLNWRVYKEFLEAVKNGGDYWHALPRDVARWWRVRSASNIDALPEGAVLGRVSLQTGDLVVEPLAKAEV